MILYEKSIWSHTIRHFSVKDRVLKETKKKLTFCGFEGRKQGTKFTQTTDQLDLQSRRSTEVLLIRENFIASRQPTIEGGQEK
jgi:hypothetical protein